MYAAEESRLISYSEGGLVQNVTQYKVNWSQEDKKKFRVKF